MMLGLTPKNAGFQITMSAHLPTSKLPTSWEMPCAIAGLMVFIATEQNPAVIEFIEMPDKNARTGEPPQRKFTLRHNDAYNDTQSHTDSGAW